MLRDLLPRPSISLVAAILLAPGALAGDLFVDANLASGAADGSSWADAFQGPDGLQAAFAAAVSGDRIFVAEGTYRPSASGNRAASFLLAAPIEVYGGCSGTEASPEQRPPLGAAPTVLTGDLADNDPGGLTDNSFHVVYASVTAVGAIVDGFIVRGGVADGSPPEDLNGGGLFCGSGSRPLIRGCRFEGNTSFGRGGAVHIAGSATPTFVGCTFSDNSTGLAGGALAAEASGLVRIERCRFEGNEAATGGAIYMALPADTIVSNSAFTDNLARGAGGGGAIATYGIGASRVRGCTLVGNRAPLGEGAGIFAANITTVTVVNSILWANEGPGGTSTLGSQLSGTHQVSYSIVEGIAAGAGNLGLDPALVDLAGRDLRPSLASPAIDAGDNGGVPAPPGPGAVVDLAGFRRFQDEPSVADTGLGAAPIVDIGALEYVTLIGQPLCAGVANSTGMPARLDALGSLAAADNDVTLAATSLPQRAFGYFLGSRGAGAHPNFDGSSGTLCLGGTMGRFDGPGQIMDTGTTSEVSLAVDLTAHPSPLGPVSVMAGETWRYQLWYRDATLGFATSNFSEAVSIPFR